MSDKFDEVVEHVKRLAPEASITTRPRKMSVIGPREETGSHPNGIGWIATLWRTEAGLATSCWCPEIGPISDSGGEVPADEDAETIARSLLKMARVDVAH